MFCIYCGADNPEDSVFCKQCGKRQPMATHPQTGTRVLPPRPPVAETGGASESAVAEPVLVGQPPPSQFSSTPAGPSVAERVVSSASPLSSQLPQMNGGALTPAQPHYPGKVGLAMATPSSPNGGQSRPAEAPVQTQAPVHTPQLTGSGGQTVLAFPEDTPNRVVLGGLAAILLGFFLPWMHLSFPGFLGIAAIDTDLSGIAGGIVAWLLVVVLVALGAFVLCQQWLYRSNPQTPRWLLAMPFAVGTFMTAVSLYTIVLVLSLQAKLAAVGGDMAANLITTQLGVYLVLLGGIILAVGGYQKLVREHGAPLR